jgi:ribosomal protein S27AE
MESAAEITGPYEFQGQVPTSAVRDESICPRCSGLMVNDSCPEVLNSTGELDFSARRCVQCGEVIDPVIERNRRLRQESRTVRFTERILSNKCVTEGQS